MLLPTVLMGIIVLVLTFLAYKKNWNTVKKSYKSGFILLYKVLPVLLFAFILSGLLEVLLPAEFVAQWLGEDSGLKGILIASFAGAAIPAGPYVTFPVISTIYQAGAGLPIVVAFVTGWAMWGTNKLPFELAFFSMKFVIVRYCIMAVFPPAAGLITQLLF